MQELIFFGVIILFSILESLARSRRAKAKAEEDGAGGVATEPERFEWAQKAPWEDDVPTYDADPSYDERALSAGRATAQRPPEPTGLPSAAEILAELAGGTKERSPARTRSIPRQSPSLPEPYAEPSGPVGRMEARTLGGDSGRRLPAPLEPVHAVHLSHRGFGTDPSDRAASEQDGLDPLAERLSATATGVRRDLRQGGSAALRRAVVLREVLGPPIALRDEARRPDE